MCRAIHIVLPLLLIIAQSLAAQPDSANYTILEGEIVDDSLGYALPFVHFWNESTRIGGIANQSGEFSIKIEDHDTIVFSSLGYFYRYYVVSDANLSQNAVVRLKPKKYEIGEAVVIGYRSYEAFKEQFLNLDPTDAKTDYLREHITELGTITAIAADRERRIKDKMEGGFGYSSSLGGVNLEKARKEEIELLKKRSQLIAEKFNRTLVADITQLEGDKLTDFIAYCNFSDEYLYEADLYTIIDAISENFKGYIAAIDTIPPVN